jgi:phage gpG-like protein
MSIKIEGLNELRNKLVKVSEKTNNPAEVYKEIAVKMWREQMDHFDKESDEYGEWQPLKASTIAQRKKGYAKILQDTGRLKNSITYGADKKGAWVKDGVNYGIYHNSDEPRNKLPKRKFLFITDEFAEQMKELFESRIMAPFKGI